jgi:hypothetical protein
MNATGSTSLRAKQSNPALPSAVTWTIFYSAKSKSLFASFSSEKEDSS